MKKEKIKLEVLIEISYTDEKGRLDAINEAKEGVLCRKVLSGNGGYNPIKSTLKK